MFRMRMYDKHVEDREILLAILDMCDVINVAFFDEEYPYIVPLNFGYEFKDDLVFYCHHGPWGHKNTLIEKNPKVCLVTHKFIDGIYNSYDKSGHDYRSVMAFGEMSFIPPDSDEYEKAWAVLTSCNNRVVPPMVLEREYRQTKVRMSKIVCRAKDVYGRAQRKLTSLDQVPFKSDPRPE